MKSGENLHGSGGKETKSRLVLKDWKLEDETNKLAEQVTEHFLLGLRENDPAILDMFYDRDIEPYRDLLPWSGEFAGKYITGAYYIYQITHASALFGYVEDFLEELIGLIAEDGYLGCYQKQCRLTGAFSDLPEKTGCTWDSWNHYHIMYGLFLWYQETDREEYLDACKRMAELFLQKFYREEHPGMGRQEETGRGGSGQALRLHEIGSTEMNLAVLHVFALLYQETGDRRYLDFAEEAIRDLEAEGTGDYIRYSKQGMDFYQCPKPRWESLHVIMGIARLYQCNGSKRYLDAAKQIFYSILKTDVHNTGGFSTDEQAVGNPWQNGNIETCCVTACNALACEVLKLTGDAGIVDFLEISHYNAVMGSFALSGRWSTYNTPMDGVRRASTNDINFQSRPGSPDLNCCSVNAPRALGNLAEWVYMEDENTVYIHYFGRGSFNTAEGLEVEIEGDYPETPVVKLTLQKMPERKTGDVKGKRLAVRIPAWSERTTVVRNGEGETLRLHSNGEDPAADGDSRGSAAADGYWYWEDPQIGDTVEIEFDFTPHLLEGHLDCSGLRCMYRGPLLFGLDASLNPKLNIDALPTIGKELLTGAGIEKMSEKGRFPGYLLMKLENGIVLTDFRHLGMTGSRYRTWLSYV